MLTVSWTAESISDHVSAAKQAAAAVEGSRLVSAEQQPTTD